MASGPSIGQIIRRIHANEISGVYTILGNDAFLQDIFIEEVSKKFLEEGGNKIYFSMDNDKPVDLFNELSSFSLFGEKSLIIVREIKRMAKSKNIINEILEYIESPNNNNCVLMLSEDFDLKSAFLKKLSSKTTTVDVRPPFEDKLIEWVKYIAKIKAIKVDLNAIKMLAEFYGDSISHVINELTKLSIMIGDNKVIDEDYISNNSILKRDYSVYKFQESIGEKDLELSIRIFDSLLESNIKLQQIIIALTNLFQQMLFLKMNGSMPKGWTGLNQIITRNLQEYTKNYSYQELFNTFRKLRKSDLLMKSAPLSDEEIFQPVIIQICQGEYV
jgi:DNA polymerase III subunit delta